MSLRKWHEQVDARRSFRTAGGQRPVADEPHDERAVALEAATADSGAVELVYT
jgi:hypothetical protein